MGDREHLMVARHAAHRLAHLKPDASADARVHLVEDQRRHAIEPRENGLERQHDARQLTARRDTREWSLLVADVERHAKFHRLRAVRSNLAQRNEHDVKAAIAHAEVGQHLVHGAAEPLRRRRTLASQ